MATDKAIVARYTNTRQKSRLVELFPWIGGGTSTTIYPYVYMSRRVYKNIHDKNPDPYAVSVLLHEEEHIERIHRAGVRRWYGRYLYSRKFRFEEELAAMIPQFAYIKSHGLTLDFNQRARVLSGHLYFWPVSRTEALRRLTEIWDNA